jgi:hypothetical protein
VTATAPGFQGGKRFAFTIMDDTDVATVDNVKPIYRLMESLGMRTTKTVWPMACPEGSANFSSSETLDDPRYREFVVDLSRRGFEIASHGATMESSQRQRTIDGFERLREQFGRFPRVHANHAYNREGIYWGIDRLDDAVLKRLYVPFNGRPAGHYLGHVPGSPYWWGDLCSDHIVYVRNLSFTTANVMSINPSMPYHDPSRPLVRSWFSACDAEDVTEFNALLQSEALDRLEREGGVCLVATHLGKGFVSDGEVHPRTRRTLESLERRGGWFPTVGELLDHLAGRRNESTLPADEWRRMQWRWAWDLARRKWSQRRRRTRVGSR